MSTSPELTPAEARVAFMAASGFTNREIARLLGRTESTVKNQINAIYRKGAANRGPVNRNELRHLYTGGTGTSGDAHGNQGFAPQFYQRARP